VLNRGVGGEEMADMLPAFDKAVLAEQPDLVLWQVAPRRAARHTLVGADTIIHEGLRSSRRAARCGPDRSPVRPEGHRQPDAERMVDLIGTAAKANNVAFSIASW